MTKSLRVLMAAVVIAAMAYGAALTLALTGNLGSATAIVVVVAGAVLLPVALFILRRRFWSPLGDRKSTRLNSSHSQISYAVFCLKKKIKQIVYVRSRVGIQYELLTDDV